MHATPPVPQAALALPVLHSPFWQQPLGQLAVVQPQTPFRHAVPAGHTTPQRPQFLASVWVLMQIPAAVRSPPGQTVGALVGQLQTFFF
jgi:hypothetical protein